MTWFKKKSEKVTKQNNTITQKKHNFKIPSPLENFIWVRFFESTALCCTQILFPDHNWRHISLSIFSKVGFYGRHESFPQIIRMSSCKSADALSLKCTLRACTVSLMLRDLFVTWINVLAITHHWQKLHYITMHACTTLTVEEQNRSTYAHDVITDTLQFPDKSALSLARWKWQCLLRLSSTQWAIRNEGSPTCLEIIHNYYKDDKFSSKKAKELLISNNFAFYFSK